MLYLPVSEFKILENRRQNKILKIFEILENHRQNINIFLGNLTKSLRNSDNA